MLGNDLTGDTWIDTLGATMVRIIHAAVQENTLVPRVYVHKSLMPLQRHQMCISVILELTIISLIN
jgi:hypothetical protein